MDRFDWIELKGKDAAAEESPRKGAPNDAPGFYAAARRLREAGHFATAAAYYERAVGLEQHNFSAWVELIDSLLRCGKLDQADAVSARVHEEYRKVRVFYASRALVLAGQDRLGEAFPLSDISLEGEGVWYARLVRAEMILKTSPEFRVEALDQLEQALDGATMPWEARFIGGWVMLRAELAPLAAAWFSEAVHTKPSAAAGLIGLGDAFQALRLYDQALFYYQKAIEVEPRHEIALARQRDCTPLLYGLIRPFRRENLRKRWNKLLAEYEPKPQPPEYDF